MAVSFHGKGNLLIHFCIIMLSISVVIFRKMSSNMALLPFEVDRPPVSHCVISDEELAGRRLFIIGDIHGCLDELQMLLNEASVTADNTLVICCGDLVNKGPKSCETVAFVRSLGPTAVRSVRGNHDEKVGCTSCVIISASTFGLTHCLHTQFSLPLNRCVYRCDGVAGF